MSEQPELVMMGAPKPMMCGGHSAARVPTEEEVAIATGHKGEVEAKLGATYESWTVCHVTSQVVAGTNFTFCVDVGAGKVQMRVFRPLPHTGNPTELSSAEAKDASWSL